MQVAAVTRADRARIAVAIATTRIGAVCTIARRATIRAVMAATREERDDQECSHDGSISQLVRWFNQFLG
jgi:hypothetical protein